MRVSSAKCRRCRSKEGLLLFGQANPWQKQTTSVGKLEQIEELARACLSVQSRCAGKGFMYFWRSTLLAGLLTKESMCMNNLVRTVPGAGLSKPRESRKFKEEVRSDQDGEVWCGIQRVLSHYGCAHVYQRPSPHGARPPRQVSVRRAAREGGSERGLTLRV